MRSGEDGALCALRKITHSSSCRPCCSGRLPPLILPSMFAHDRLGLCAICIHTTPMRVLLMWGRAIAACVLCSLACFIPVWCSVGQVVGHPVIQG